MKCRVFGDLQVGIRFVGYAAVNMFSRFGMIVAMFVMTGMSARILAEDGHISDKIDFTSFFDANSEEPDGGLSNRVRSGIHDISIKVPELKNLLIAFSAQLLSSKSGDYTHFVRQSTQPEQ